MIEVNQDHSTPQQGSVFVRLARGVYAFGAGLFVGCIVLQVFLAGAGVLVDPRYWAMHTVWGHSIQVFPIFLLLVGLLARLPWRMLLLTALVFVLFMLQYLFLWVLPGAVGIKALRALHAVNALAFFWIALYLAQRSCRLLRAPQRPQRADRLATTGTAHTPR